MKLELIVFVVFLEFMFLNVLQTMFLVEYWNLWFLWFYCFLFWCSLERWIYLKNTSDPIHKFFYPCRALSQIRIASKFILTQSLRNFLMDLPKFFKIGKLIFRGSSNSKISEEPQNYFILRNFVSRKCFKLFYWYYQW